MNPRIAAVLLIGFIAVLVFFYAMSMRRERGKKALLAAQCEKIRQYQILTFKIQKIAREAADVDPSAALIDLTITDFKNKELL